MKINLHKTQEIIKSNKAFLQDKFHVKTIGIFGSYRQGTSCKNSDVDILVEFNQPISMFAFMDLENYLEKKIGTDVDLVTKKALKPAIGKQILSEVVYI